MSSMTYNKNYMNEVNFYEIFFLSKFDRFGKTIHTKWSIFVNQDQRCQIQKCTKGRVSTDLV